MSLIPSIQVDFSQFMAAKNNINAITSNLKDNSVSGIKDHMNATVKSWDENAKDSFIRKEENITDILLQKIYDIEALVDSIEKDALIIFDAELYSRGLAINRIY